MKKRMMIAVLILCLAAAMMPAGTYADTAKADTSNEELGLIIDGKGITKGCGFQKDFAYITAKQISDAKEKKTAEGLGLGSCWVGDRVFSSYDHHINSDPIYYFSRGAGLDIKIILETVGVDADKMEELRITGSDDYSITFHAPNIFANRYYFAPGSETGMELSGPILALYKTTNGYKWTSEQGKVPAAAEKLTRDDNVLMYGQTSVTEDTNCRFIAGVDNIIAGEEKKAISTENNEGRSLTMTDILRTGIFKTENTKVYRSAGFQALWA